MVWEQLSVNKPHLAYLILGGFTSLFMLCSLFVKEKLYIGEATVATLCGVIFGPHAANIFNPITWGNTDQITLECSRVVLVVQCFAIGVELPKAYMERHWRSVLFLLVPVMTFGWLVTSLFIWWMIVPLTWLESLMCAACVTATDPVLASSVVGKGKFAKRVPKHLRDLLSAESGCNDGMAFPFIYLSFYLIHYKLDGAKVTYHWFCNTILYECIFGAIYGVLIGYMGRHAIKWADRHDLVDRESFLVFYFVLALFCAGTGATLGTDDLLVGFAAGVGFSNDGWFTQKTEESHVSNVIDLLLNLAYFVYLGAIIPWEQYNNPIFGLTPWRLVIISLFVLFFRRIPIMLALKPFIPDIKTWREALFAGHFGPIGVGAIFAAILARAELETDTTEPLAVVPTDPASENYTIVQIIWPLTTFLVITSILVHGSSVAVFTLGKHINNFTLTMSYTQANEEGPSWMNRLPRMANKSMSKNRDDFEPVPSTEKDYPPGDLPPVGMPGTFLRRQKEEDTPIERPPPSHRNSRDANWPIEESAIRPQRRNNEPELETYEEGEELIVEDEEGNVVGVHPTQGVSAAQKAQFIDQDEKKVRGDSSGYFAKDKKHPHAAEDETSELEEEVAHPVQTWRKFLKPSSKKPKGAEKWKKPKKEEAASEIKIGQAANAYQFGQTLIVEDADGEVIKKIDLGRKSTATTSKKNVPQEDDDRIRFTLGGGQRMSKREFVQQLQQMDPKSRRQAVDNLPDKVKEEVKVERPGLFSRRTTSRAPEDMGIVRRTDTTEDAIEEQAEIPTADVNSTVQKHTEYGNDETAAQRRRRALLTRQDSDDDGTERVPPPPSSSTPPTTEAGETKAERRRRLAALGIGGETQGEEGDSEEDGTPRDPTARRGIRFAEEPNRASKRKSVTR